jgi:hypothetical protein
MKARSTQGSNNFEKGENTMKFPKRIAITVDDNSSGPIAERLLAWANVLVAEDGPVAVYELVDEFDKRDIPNLRRKGTRKWFKA